ncbi:hypothetical protein F4W70_26735 [Pseudomonas cannabina]|nr:hypothetical protein F4W70_26735 [Pseudomonas cannabina]
MACLITGVEQFDTRMRVAQKKKATEWLKLFGGSIFPNHDSWEQWNHCTVPNTFKSQPWRYRP